MEQLKLAVGLILTARKTSCWTSSMSLLSRKLSINRKIWKQQAITRTKLIAKKKEVCPDEKFKDQRRTEIEGRGGPNQETFKTVGTSFSVKTAKFLSSTMLDFQYQSLESDPQSFLQKKFLKKKRRKPKKGGGQSQLHASHYMLH